MGGVGGEDGGGSGGGVEQTEKRSGTVPVPTTTSSSSGSGGDDDGDSGGSALTPGRRKDMKMLESAQAVTNGLRGFGGAARVDPSVVEAVAAAVERGEATPEMVERMAGLVQVELVLPTHGFERLSGFTTRC